LPRLGSNGSFGRSSGFNFKDLSMSRSQSQENFGGKLAPLRGSSPTASLAADLSQNFYIDQRQAIAPFRIPQSPYS
jgi:M-phase inducer tyrosine phosphatase